MAILIGLILFSLLMAAITYVGYQYYAKPGRVYDQLGAVATSGSTLDEGPGDNIVAQLVRKMGDLIGSSGDKSITQRYLIAAGYRTEAAVSYMYGLKVIGAICLGGGAMVFSDLLPLPGQLQLATAALGGLAGYALPGFVLDLLVSQRQENIKYALPDALDLMVVCVEAGLGLDQAIMNVSRQLKEAHPDLSEEFELLNLEIQAGSRRSEALRSVADRTGVAELKKLVAVLVQTDRFGTSMADSLRAHSDYMRIRRRQDAEERAGKVGVKLVFPIFFCILPAMLLVVAGPGLLQIMKYLFPMMRQFKG